MSVLIYLLSNLPATLSEFSWNVFFDICSSCKIVMISISINCYKNWKRILIQLSDIHGGEADYNINKLLGEKSRTKY